MGGYGRTPYATESHDTSQKSGRNPNVTPWLIVIHHAATENFRSVVTMELGTKQVSSTVVVKDGQVASMFDEAYRAWSLSSTYYDSVSLSSETCNSGGAAQGWPISEASYQTLAKIVAEWCRKYGIPANRERIIGHREVYSRYGASYATACPGGINLDRLVSMVNNILTGTAGGGINPIEDDMFTDQDRYLMAEIKQIITGPSDGSWLGVMGQLGIIKQGLAAKKGTDGWDGVDEKLNQVLAKVSSMGPAGSIDTKALARDIASQVNIPAGASKADVEAAVTAAFGKVFL